MISLAWYMKVRLFLKKIDSTPIRGGVFCRMKMYVDYHGLTNLEMLIFYNR